MSESTAPSPEATQSRRSERPTEQGRQVEAGEFELRRTELADLLLRIHHELARHGMPISTAQGRAPRVKDRMKDEEERKRVKEVTATMFRELESRLAVFAGACVRLDEDERAGLAGLLRLPDTKRRAIMAILRLPERERSVMRVVFALSEPECNALAELLKPLPRKERPSIVIVDPSVLEEEEG
jgi:hypothetical protein